SAIAIARQTGVSRDGSLATPPFLEQQNGSALPVPHNLYTVSVIDYGRETANYALRMTCGLPSGPIERKNSEFGARRSAGTSVILISCSIAASLAVQRETLKKPAWNSPMTRARIRTGASDSLAS